MQDTDSMSQKSLPDVNKDVKAVYNEQLRDKKSLRAYIYALIAFRNSPKQKNMTMMSTAEITKHVQHQKDNDAPRATIFAGVSAVFDDIQSSVVIAIAIRDTVYSLDYAITVLDKSENSIIINHIISELRSYSHNNTAKFIGIGIPQSLAKKIPELCSRLWLDLDIVPIVLNTLHEKNLDKVRSNHWDYKSVDEQADSLARKCIMWFGPDLAPILQVGYRGTVKTDAGFSAHLVNLEDYKRTCGPATWGAMNRYATSLTAKNTKIAFFSSTPQGGGVALMRHALIRLSKLLDVDLKWYVPKPKPGVFRLTKNMHNILQGVSDAEQRLTPENFDVLSAWIEDTADRYWFAAGGPLRPVKEGGANIIIIDDPQMPGLIPMIKKLTPNRPVLYRSHIQIRSDLISRKGSPQAEVWEYLWSNIRHADLFISHPIPSFVPENVPCEKVAYLPATTDWLDGLNKDIDAWNTVHYRNTYNDLCHSSRMISLLPPPGKYIIQEARFDPAKGIPDVLASYASFRERLDRESSKNDLAPPQLVICGHGSVDDPDGKGVYEQTMIAIYTRYSHLADSISVMRIPPSDQLLNTLLSSAYVCLQLSIREGFEVKVSEALHKGIPVIATRRGGIPLQVQHGKNGFLVDSGDFEAVAGYLYTLWTEDGVHDRMSKFAAASVSDEVSTVGNALAWFYLADVWTSDTKGEDRMPKQRWVNDLAREFANVPYGQEENRLPRSLLLTE